MSYRYDGDAATEMLERRWFATDKLVESMRSQCDVLREAAMAAEVSWSHARTQLAELEALRDALGDQLSRMDEYYPEPEPQPRRSVMSAA